MGSLFSKPRPRDLIDSAVFADGLSPLKRAHYTATEDGRFLFGVGNHKKTSVGLDPRAMYDPDHAYTHELDIFDLFTSKRIRIPSIGDLYEYIEVVGLYAIDENTLVIVETLTRRIRQLVVTIDRESRTAESLFYRTYYFRNLGSVNIIVGEEYAIAASIFLTPSTGFMFPVNPLSPKPKKNLTDLFARANAHVMQHIGSGCIATPPFFKTKTELACFTWDRFRDEWSFDPTILIVIDITNNTVSVLNTGPFVSQPPLSCIQYADWYQRNNGELIYSARYRRTGGWQVSAGNLVYWLSDICHLVRYSSRTPEWLRWIPASLYNSLVKLMWVFREPRIDEMSKIAILNTETLEWTEIKAPFFYCYESQLHLLKDGNLIITSTTDDVSSSRIVGNRSMIGENADRIRLIRNPLRMHSLVDLAAIAVRKSGIATSEELEMLAGRVL